MNLTMLTLTTPNDNILKGEQFATRLAQVCGDLPPVTPLEGIKYKRILIPGIVGGEIQFAQLSFLAHALRMRGAEVTALLCDGFLPACTLKKVDHHESACTRWCHTNIGPFARAAQLPHRWYSEFITEREKQECLRLAQNVKVDELRSFEYRGIPLGFHVDRSVESFFKVGAYDLDDPAIVAKGREFLTAAMWLTIIGERALDELQIEKVFMEDGEKTDWGILRAVARHRGIPVDVVLGAPRGHSLLIEHDRFPEPNEQMPLWSKWRDIPLTGEQNEELDTYFQSRTDTPYEDQKWTATASVEDEAELRFKIGLPDRVDGLLFSMFPNLSFDAKLTTKTPTFDTAAEWVAQTVKFFERYPQHHLIVKVHPSEAIQNVKDPTVPYLTARFNPLPPNVHVISPTTDIMAIDVMRLSDVVMVYTSTVGVEAAYFGKPVINVGGGWHVGRGFSTDALTKEQYEEALDDICSQGEPPTAPQELGRRYAYAVFFRSLMPIKYYKAMYPNITELPLQSLKDLAPGCDPTIDQVCRGVLFEEPFCRPEDIDVNSQTTGV